MDSKKKKEEKNPETQATYWVGAKAHIDIVVDGLFYNLSFPSNTSTNSLAKFASTVQQIIKDIVEKKQKEIDELDEQDEQ